MTKKEWFHEIPYDENVDDPTDHIVEVMAGLELDLDPEAVRRLVREARHVNRMVLSEWLRRNEPGSPPGASTPWQAPRRLPGKPKGKDVYSKWKDKDFDKNFAKEWDAWWRENWGRGRGNPGRFRDGSDIPKPPLVAIYYLVNGWWRCSVGTPFWPDFQALHLGDDYEGVEKFEFINPAARFFVEISAAVDFFNYTAERCKKIHDTYYRHLDTTIPE